MRTRGRARCARMEVAPCLIIYRSVEARTSWPRSGQLVLGFDAWQENLCQVIGLELGRGVGLAVFTDQVVLNLAVRVAVAGRELDKFDRRIHR